MPSVGLCVQIACIWEATARKPGNVHPYADFQDLTYVDLLQSAAVIAPIFDVAWRSGVGKTILEAVRATRRVTATNSNLGIVLLLAPLAAVPPEEDLQQGLPRVLGILDVDDARAAYQAIQLAAAGGLGRAPEQDIHEVPTKSLRAAMALAAERDLVARQYANGFQEVLNDGVPALHRGLEQMRCLEDGIVFCYLQLLSRYPDSLIVRKRGPAEALEASRRAQVVLDLGWPKGETSQQAIIEFDRWLRAESHSRNPGTTADLVAACLFVLLRQGTIKLPPQFRWSRPQNCQQPFSDAGSDHG